MEVNAKTKESRSKDEALKKQREEDESKEYEPYWFEGDLGSNNSGYYELQAILTHKGRDYHNFFSTWSVLIRTV